MFGDTFDTVEEIMSGTNYGAVASVQSRRPKNCASDLDLPELTRLREYKIKQTKDDNQMEQEGENEQLQIFKQFAGVKNQGATCYLNSLIQSCFMSPEFRQAIYSIPICGKTIEEKSGYIKNEKKFKILLAFQKLFAELEYLDVRAVSTEELTKSFGWGDNEGLEQQDVQEALRVIYDALERALSDTPLKDTFMNHYKGIMVNHITCMKCNNSNEREEDFYDLILQVQGFNSVEESMRNLVTPEILDGDNQYFCDNCNCKNDAQKGQKIRIFPDILTISLNRFVFDFQTFTRVKVDSELKFGLELDISQYLEDKQMIQENDPNCKYELQTVLIHRGNAHGGHYHAYIRDTMKEGEWEQLMKNLTEEQQERENKQKQQQQEQQQNGKDNNEKENNNVIQEADNEDSNNEDNNNNEELEITKKNSSKNKSQKKKSKKQSNTPHPSGKNAKQRKKEKSQQKNAEKKKQAIIDMAAYDNIDYPIPYENQELAKNWYDFNDNTVSVIPVNRLQSQFGGNSESGYILIYRRKTLQPQKQTQLPVYLQKYIQEKNQVMEDERNAYKEAEQHIEMFFTQPSNLNFDKYQWNENYDIEKEGDKIKFNVNDSLRTVLNKVQEKYPAQGNIQILEVEAKQNKILHFLKIYNNQSADLEKSIKDLEISHYSQWIILDNSEQSQDIEVKVKNIIGEDCVPIILQMVVQGKPNQEIIAWGNMKLKKFRQLLCQKYPEVQYEQQYIKEYSGNDQVNHLNNEPEKEEKTLFDLKIYNNHDLILQKIDQDLLKECQNKMQQQKEIEEQMELEQKNQVSVLVETDDSPESKRLFVTLDITVNDLVTIIKKQLDIDQNLKRRLRKLQYNQLFFENEYEKKLNDFEDFREGGMRLQIERGDIPLSGNIVIKFINQSNQLLKDQGTEITNSEQFILQATLDKNNRQEVIIDQKDTLLELKKRICEKVNLNPEEHKLYKTDHLEEPFQAFNPNQYNNLAKSLNLKSGDLVCLRHKTQLIGSEMKHFKIFLTKSGLPDDSKLITELKISEQSTLKQLKEEILQNQQINPQSKIQDTQLLRIRTIKKDQFFGNILRKEDKNLKKFNFPTQNIVVQILENPENLEDNDICLILMKRDVQNRQYIDQQEFVFKAGPSPSIENLYDAVIQYLNNKNSQQNIEIEKDFEKLTLNDIKLAKYFPYEYHYTEISQESLDDYIKTNKRKASKKQSKKQEHNIRKVPFLIKDDGDMIGYRLENENLELLDDFQTEHDNYMLEQMKENKRLNQIQNEAKYSSKGGKETGVKIQSFDEEEEIALALKQVEEFEKLEKMQQEQNQQ